MRVGAANCTPCGPRPTFRRTLAQFRAVIDGRAIASSSWGERAVSGRCCDDAVGSPFVDDRLHSLRSAGRDSHEQARQLEKTSVPVCRHRRGRRVRGARLCRVGLRRGRDAHHVRRRSVQRCAFAVPVSSGSSAAAQRLFAERALVHVHHQPQQRLVRAAAVSVFLQRRSLAGRHQHVQSPAADVPADAADERGCVRWIAGRNALQLHDHDPLRPHAHSSVVRLWSVERACGLLQSTASGRGVGGGRSRGQRRW